MNYPEALAYLYALGNEVQTMKFGLATTRAILAGLGNPQDDYPSVIVAGTNGKGSVASFIHQSLVESGMRSGLFTSPHLEKIEERIRIGNSCISSSEFAESFTAVLEASRALGLPSHPTFFELVTCTALLSFARSEVDAAVLEVGMGGRLDSTNTVDPVLSIITSISLDHQQYLGETLPLIAAEKAGILRKGVPAVSAEQPDEVKAALRMKAEEKGTTLVFTGAGDYRVAGNRGGCYSFRYRGEAYQLGVPGIHQVGNAVVALHCLGILAGMGWPVTPQSSRLGISAMRRPGVLEVIRGTPDVILDGGHNPDAALQLRAYLESHSEGPLTLVFGMMRDKNIRATAEILEPLFEKIFLVPINSSRALNTGEMKASMPDGICTANAGEALEKALECGNTVVVAGSFYLAGEIRTLINKGQANRRPA